MTYPTAEQTDARARILAAHAEQMFAFFEANAKTGYLPPWEFARIGEIYREVTAEIEAAAK